MRRHVRNWKYNLYNCCKTTNDGAVEIIFSNAFNNYRILFVEDNIIDAFNYKKRDSSKKILWDAMSTLFEIWIDGRPEKGRISVFCQNRTFGPVIRKWCWGRNFFFHFFPVGVAPDWLLNRTYWVFPSFNCLSRRFGAFFSPLIGMGEF